MCTVSCVNPSPCENSITLTKSLDVHDWPLLCPKTSNMDSNSTDTACGHVVEEIRNHLRVTWNIVNGTLQIESQRGKC